MALTMNNIAAVTADMVRAHLRASAAIENATIRYPRLNEHKPALIAFIKQLPRGFDIETSLELACEHIFGTTEDAEDVIFYPDSQPKS